MVKKLWRTIRNSPPRYVFGSDGSALAVRIAPVLECVAVFYDAAERLGCNKIALGHHRDDALETLLMNLFFQGRMQAMPAGYRTDDDRFDVIRPLIECAEDKIAEYASMREFPILPCNLCGSQSGLQRDQMTQLLNNLESSIPNVREVMLASLKNVRTSHL